MNPSLRTYCLITLCLVVLSTSAQQSTYHKDRCLFVNETEESYPFNHNQTEWRNTETICMVIHILQRPSEIQITDARIETQMDRINRDFQGLDNNLPLIPEIFHQNIGIPNFKFILANKNPDGQPSNGIVRKETSVNNIGSVVSRDGKDAIKFNTLGGSDAWHPDSCINVWVGATTDFFGVASPLDLAGSPEDGIIIAPEAFGLVPISIDEPVSTGLGRTLTHELGHYFGLSHLWGPSPGRCDNDADGIEDTPVQEDIYTQCPEFPQVTCNSSDMVNNYMQFTDDDCLLFFTNGQVQRMRNVLKDIRSGILVSSNDLSIEENLNFEIRQSDGSLEIIHDNKTSNFAKVAIFNTSGQLILNEQLNSINVHTIDTNSWPRAVYILSILDANRRFTHTFIAGY